MISIRVKKKKKLLVTVAWVSLSIGWIVCQAISSNVQQALELMKIPLCPVPLCVPRSGLIFPNKNHKGQSIVTLSVIIIIHIY